MDVVVQTVADALALGSLYALFGLGIALVFGVMRLVNFAHGDLVMVGAFVMALAGAALGSWVVPVTVVAVLAVALVVERLAFRPLRGAGAEVLLVASFGISLLLQNTAILVLGARPRSGPVPDWLTGSVVVSGASVPRVGVVTIVVTGLLLAGVTVFLRATPLGVRTRAAAEDFRAARLLGVRADAVVATSFALAGVLAGVAAVLLFAQTGTVDQRFGLTPVIYGFVATVLGGLGRLAGAVTAGLLLGALSVSLQQGLPVEVRPFRDALLFGVVMVLIVLRPHGLFTPASARERV